MKHINRSVVGVMMLVVSVQQTMALTNTVSMSLSNVTLATLFGSFGYHGGVGSARLSISPITPQNAAANLSILGCTTAEYDAMYSAGSDVSRLCKVTCSFTHSVTSALTQATTEHVTWSIPASLNGRLYFIVTNLDCLNVTALAPASRSREFVIKLTDTFLNTEAYNSQLSAESNGAPTLQIIQAIFALIVLALATVRWVLFLRSLRHTRNGLTRWIFSASLLSCIAFVMLSSFASFAYWRELATDGHSTHWKVSLQRFSEFVFGMAHSSLLVLVFAWSRRASCRLELFGTSALFIVAMLFWSMYQRLYLSWAAGLAIFAVAFWCVDALSGFRSEALYVANQSTATDQVATDDTADSLDDDQSVPVGQISSLEKVPWIIWSVVIAVYSLLQSLAFSVTGWMLPWWLRWLKVDGFFLVLCAAVASLLVLAPVARPRGVAPVKHQLITFIGNTDPKDLNHPQDPASSSTTTSESQSQ